MKSYLLDGGGNPVPEEDHNKWFEWFSNSRSDRLVKQETIGDSFVSTVFLGVDHSMDGVEPVLWETTVFGGDMDGEMDRCSGSRDDAMAMHLVIAEKVKSKLSTK